MPSSSSLALGGAVAAAAIIAALRSPPQRSVVQGFEEAAPRGDIEPEALEPTGEDLPPDHPPIGSPGLFAEQADDAPHEQSALRWKVPAKWTATANPNTMRLATYHVPAALGTADDAEVSVVRAGGSADANLARWNEQFTNVDEPKRSQKSVRGLAIAILDIGGTFTAGGMGPNVASGPRPGWRLAGAVVDTPEGAYFFKLTGPSASVRAARKDFDALLDSLELAAPSPPIP